MILIIETEMLLKKSSWLSKMLAAQPWKAEFNPPNSHKKRGEMVNIYNPSAEDEEEKQANSCDSLTKQPI